MTRGTPSPTNSRASPWPRSTAPSSPSRPITEPRSDGCSNRSRPRWWRPGGPCWPGQAALAARRDRTPDLISSGQLLFREGGRRHPRHGWRGPEEPGQRGRAAGGPPRRGPGDDGGLQRVAGEDRPGPARITSRLPPAGKTGPDRRPRPAAVTRPCVRQGEAGEAGGFVGGDADRRSSASASSLTVASVTRPGCRWHSRSSPSSPPATARMQAGRCGREPVRGPARQIIPARRAPSVR